MELILLQLIWNWLQIQMSSLCHFGEIPHYSGEQYLKKAAQEPSKSLPTHFTGSFIYTITKKSHLYSSQYNFKEKILKLFSTHTIGHWDFCPVPWIILTPFSAPTTYIIHISTGKAANGSLNTFSSRYLIWRTFAVANEHAKFYSPSMGSHYIPA